jgi:ribonuclease HI
VTDAPLVAVYADESCLGNGREGSNPGGAGALVEFRRKAGDIVRRDLWISERATTNNRMALRSVIESFRALSAKGRNLHVVFTTDSRYLVDGMREWVHGWAARGWTRKTGQIENLELWHDAIRAVASHSVEWRWVRGHAGHPQNEYANHLATRAAAELSESGGLVASQFEEWLRLQRDKGKMGSDLAAFPEVESFRAGRPLPRVK